MGGGRLRPRSHGVLLAGAVAAGLATTAFAQTPAPSTLPPAAETTLAFTDTLRTSAFLVAPSDSLLLGAPFDVGAIWITPVPVSNVILLTPPEALEPLELVDVERGLDRGDTITVRVRLRAFDVGWVIVPALTWAGVTADDRLVLAETERDSVIVASIVPENAEGLADLHEAVPLNGRRWWGWWALAGAIVLGVVFAIWRWRRARGASGVVAAHEAPAHEAALARLEALRKDPRSRSGPWKPFYSDVTDTLRSYVWRRYGVPAPDFTTYETMRALRGAGIDDGALDTVQAVLETADGIKFAKDQPTAAAAGADIDRAIAFVTATQPPPPTPTDESPAGAEEAPA